MSQVDAKRALNKMKHDLEAWRVLILSMDSVLKWEKNFYPAIIFGVISFLFMLLWLLELSTVTLLSLIGLIVVLFELLYPSLAALLFDADNWSGAQENKFVEICGDLLAIKTNIIACYNYVFNGKEKRSTTFNIIVSVVFLTLAWIGAVFNNLLLFYFIFLCLAMYPGIRQQGLWQQVKQMLGGAVGGKLSQAYDKKSE